MKYQSKAPSAKNRTAAQRPAKSKSVARKPTQDLGRKADSSHKRRGGTQTGPDRPTSRTAPKKLISDTVHAPVAVSESTVIQHPVTIVDATEGDHGQRIDNFLLRIWKHVPKSHVYRLLRKGEVRVNGKRAKPEYRVQSGDKVRLPPIRIDAERSLSSMPPSTSLKKTVESIILYEDRDFLVVNKPAGLAVHGGSGLAHGVIEAMRASRPDETELELVHRIDRDTSGCLLIAKRRAVLRELHAQLREREMDKRYLALLVGKWTLGTKKLSAPLKTNQKEGGERVVRVHPEGQTADSTFKKISSYGSLATLMEVHIGTGRTHQIRVHSAYAGHPVAGDEKYGDKEADKRLKEYGLRRMFLHAHTLSFERPGTGEVFKVTAPLDAELQGVLDRLAEATNGSAKSGTFRER